MAPRAWLGPSPVPWCRGLEPHARVVALEAAAKIKLHGQRAAESIVAIGEELARVRDTIASDDTFEAWIKAEFDWSRRSAYRFVSVAENRANLAREDLHLVDVSALYVLNSPSTPEPVREIAREQAADGVRVTHADVKAHVDRFREQARRHAKPAGAAPDEDAGEPPLPLDAPAAVEPAAYDPAKRRAFDLAFEAWAAGQGADRLMLSVVEQNRRALRFWRGLGFTVTRKLPPRRFGSKEHARLEMARVPGAPVRAREGVARFLDGEGRVTVYPSARKDKRQVLAYLAERFEPDRPFTEREVNQVLRRHHMFEDWALLRRELFDEGFLDRDRDGARYWRSTDRPTGKG